jgi:hypothetical protein
MSTFMTNLMFSGIEARLNNDNNNSIQFFIIYVPSQQLQGQLQPQHSVIQQQQQQQ